MSACKCKYGFNTVSLQRLDDNRYRAEMVAFQYRIQPCTISDLDFSCFFDDGLLVETRIYEGCCIESIEELLVRWLTAKLAMWNPGHILDGSGTT